MLDGICRSSSQRVYGADQLPHLVVEGVLSIANSNPHVVGEPQQLIRLAGQSTNELLGSDFSSLGQANQFCTGNSKPPRQGANQCRRVLKYLTKCLPADDAGLQPLVELVEDCCSPFPGNPVGYQAGSQGTSHVRCCLGREAHLTQWTNGAEE
ncbi:hypothetical protein D3C84_892300 [compost metagenome]